MGLFRRGPDRAAEVAQQPVDAWAGTGRQAGPVEDTRAPLAPPVLQAVTLARPDDPGYLAAAADLAESTVAASVAFFAAQQPVMSSGLRPAASHAGRHANGAPEELDVAPRAVAAPAPAVSGDLFGDL